MATKAKAKKKTKALPKTKDFGGKRFTKKMCGKTKADAKKSAERYRKTGKSKNARVVKDPASGKYCVFTRG